MDRRWAKIIHFTAALLASPVAILAMAEAIYGIYTGQREIPIVALLFAGAIWLIGYFVRLLARL
jgi:hypothetical protein